MKTFNQPSYTGCLILSLAFPFAISADTDSDVATQQAPSVNLQSSLQPELSSELSSKLRPELRSSLIPNMTLSKQQLTETDQSVQLAPISVTVITKRDIEASYRSRLEELDGYVPGMIIDALGSSPQGAAIAIRGIQSDRPDKSFLPAVAVSIDGVYVGSHAGQNPYLFDFEQIEVRRGAAFAPIGAEAGTINIQRTKPTGKLGLDTRIAVRDPDATDIDAVFNFPIINGLSGKVSASQHSVDDADAENAFISRDENSEERTAVSLSLLWNQLEHTSIAYTFDFENDDSDTPALMNLSSSADLVCSTSIGGANCSPGGDVPASGKDNITTQNFSNKRTYEGDYHTLRVDSELMEHKITSITGYRTTEEQSARDFDASSTDVYSSSFDRIHDQFSTELRADRQWSDNLHYTVGFYYQDSEYDLDRVDQYALDTLSGVIPPQLQTPVPANQLRQASGSYSSEYISLFGNVNYRLDHQWDTNVSLRYTSADKSFKQNIKIQTDATSGAVFSNTVFADDKDWDEISGSFGLSYVVDDQAMIYFRYAVDHTLGGFFESANSLEASRYSKSQSTQTVELGMKSDWFEDKLRLNMVLYNNYQDDIVQEVADRMSDGSIQAVLDNVADLEVNGFDLEFEYVPTDNLKFRGSYARMNTNYERYQVTDLATPGEVLQLDLDSARAPTSSIYLTGQYLIPFGQGQFSLFAGYRYVTDYQTQPGLVVAEVPDYTTWDVAVAYAWNDLTVRLFSQNFNDKRFLTNHGTSNNAQVAPISSSASSTTGISTYAEVSSPRYTGLEIVWTPSFKLSQ